MRDEKKTMLTFTPAQNRVITTSFTLFCGAAIVLTCVALLLLVLHGMGYFFHIVGPVIVAFYLSLLTKPWYIRLNRWFHGRTLWAILVFALSFLIPLLLLCAFFGAFILEQGTSLIRHLPQIVESTHRDLLDSFPEAEGMLANVFPNLSDYLSSEGAVDWNKLMLLAKRGVSVGGTVFSVGSATLLWLLTFFYWVIFVMKEPLTGEAFAAKVPFIANVTRDAVARYFRNFNDIIVSYFRGQIIDVIIQGLLYGTVFQFVGLPNGFIIGFVLGILNLVPYLGVIIGLSVALPVAFVSNGLGFTVGIFCIFTVIQTFDGYVMQPRIQGGRMKLSAWQIVFALLFWTHLGGFLGLLLAIPLTAFVKASWDEWRDSSKRFMSNDLTEVTNE
ncbi:MAG: AI-2E family transporter [Kiritimatiellia bacterium]